MAWAAAGGASGRALSAGMLLGFVGMIVGLFFGRHRRAARRVLIGSIAGIVLVEYRNRKNIKGAARGGAGWLAGYPVSTLVEFTYWAADGRLIRLAGGGKL